MIIRIIVVDPQPDPKRGTDLLVYQVPEKSRELAVLSDLLDKSGLEWAVVHSAYTRKKRKKKNDTLS